MIKNTVVVNVNGTRTNALCDTGASVSCISQAFLERAFPKNKPHFETSTIKTIVGVGGTHHAVNGLISLDICFGTVKLSSKFYVVKDLHHSLIFGIDFMEKHRVTLDIPSKKFIIQDFLKVCSLTTETGLARTIRSVGIDPHSEVNVPVKISKTKSGTQVLLEPLESLSRQNILGAKCLVTVTKGRAVLRVINPTDKPVYLNSNKTLAVVVPVDERCVYSIDDIAENQTELDNSLGPSDIESSTRTTKLKFTFDLSDSDLNDTEKQKLLALLGKNSDIFSEGLHDLGCTTLQTHKIETGDAPPVSLPPYKQNPVVREATREWVDKMLENEIIEPSQSNWHSPVVLVKRAGSNEYRFAVDYRRLNKISKPQAFPLPTLSSIFDAIGESNAQYFSSLDLGKAFWQVPLDPDSREKASFICAEGIFSFKKMPFGLSGAPATFQSLLMKVLRGISWKYVITYVDDVIIFSPTFERHCSDIQEVFNRLRKAGLKLSPGKCHFAKKKLNYLGHVISKEGIGPDPKKVEKIENLQAPTDQKGVKSLLGLVNWYKKFIPGYSKICAPLFQLLQKNTKFVWTEKCQNALDILKKLLCSSPILAFPDMNKPFILTCDASKSGLGYILGQLDNNGKERVIEYSGRSLQPAEKNYSVSELECLAIVSGVKAFSSYLSTDIPFSIVTDHQALKVLNSVTTSQNGRIARWALFLQGFRYTVHYRKGKLNHADVLSRLTAEASAKEPVAGSNSSSQPVTTDKIQGNNSFTMGTMDHENIKSKSVIQDFTKTHKELKNEVGHINTLNSDQECDTHEPYLEVTFEYDYKNSVFSTSTDRDSKLDSQGNWGTLDDTSKLIEMQQKCPDFAHIYKFLSTGELPEDDKLARKTMYDKEFYEIVDGLLIHKYQSRGKKKPTDEKFIIHTALPKKLRIQIMQEYHDHHGHFGVKKTFTSIQQKWWWPHQYQEIVDFVKSCDTCQRAKHSTHQVSTPLNPLPVVNIFERMHLDIVGPLHKTKDGFEYILVCVDSFSRWVEAFSLRTQTAAEIARILHDEIFCRYGAPISIVTDRGQNFLSKLVNAVCEIYNVRRHRTASYNPKANGSCERQNATLIQTLRMYVDKDQSNWNSLLPIALQALRSSPNTETSGFSPYKMLFGGEMRLPMDVNLVPRETLGPEPKQHVQQLLERMKTIRNIAKQNTETSQQDAKVRHDQKAKPSDFKVMEQVMWKLHKHTPGLTPKLEYKWKGPYYILKKISHDTYKLAESGTHKQVRAPVNAKDIKKYFDPDNYRYQPDLGDSVRNKNVNEAPQNSGTSSYAENGQKAPQMVNPDVQKAEKVIHSNNQTNTSDLDGTQTEQSNSGKNDVWYTATRILKQRFRFGIKEYLIEWKNKKYKPSWQAEKDVSEELKRLFYVTHTKKGTRRKRPYKYFD